MTTDIDTLQEKNHTRIESERPVDGVQVPTRSKLELAAYLMFNGSRFVTLIDDSEETWEAYCAERVDNIQIEIATSLWDEAAKRKSENDDFREPPQ